MVECRNCRGTFKTPPETIGARCPDCRMPLFERLDRPRREIESGRCGFHPELPGVVSCQRCRKRLCTICRTRWHEEFLCPECVEKSIALAEENPRELRSRQAQATRGVALAVGGCGLFVLGFSIFMAATLGGGGTAAAWGVGLMMAGLVPAAWSLGESAAVVLRRGPRFGLATSVVTMAASQIGITLSLLFVNLWRN
jgi:hypothetical protein